MERQMGGLIRSALIRNVKKEGSHTRSSAFPSFFFFLTRDVETGDVPCWYRNITKKKKKLRELS